MIIGKALQFRQTVAALADIAYGLTTVIYWTPIFPFRSSLSGESCQQSADEYEKRNGEQWSQPLYHHALFEHQTRPGNRAETDPGRHLTDGRG